MRFHDSMYFAHGEKLAPSLTPSVKAFKIIGDANLTTSRTFESNCLGYDNYAPYSDIGTVAPPCLAVAWVAGSQSFGSG
jgi:hypothetical protein